MINLDNLHKQLFPAFNRRWNIVDNQNQEVEFIKFKTRILNISKNIDTEVGAEGVRVFCLVLGIPEEWRIPTSVSIVDHSYSKNIIKRLNTTVGFIEYIRVLQLILNLPFESETRKKIYLRDVKEIISISNINTEIAQSKEGVILYPAGEKILDQELVNFPLTFLSGKSNTLFMDALKEYQESKNWKSAESLRKCFEEYLRAVFKNNEILTNNIKNLKSLLKGKTEPQLLNIITEIPTRLDQYFNDNSKHHTNEIPSEDNELLIYQVGLLLRFINTKQQ